MTSRSALALRRACARSTFAGVEVWSAPSTAYQFRPGASLPGRVLEGSGHRVIEIDGEQVDSAVCGVSGVP